ncbi:hypothetical protein GRAN_3450 [Granulicella sibirica]|uniref:Uncharacterized protein n=1 Tax=Granulicella sibirica TaxID=2479048 RepID=A0A4Q0SZ76_9BACT|nr:hypothetical protein GRAN_3450 [Granulicella sibirica]
MAPKAEVAVVLAVLLVIPEGNLRLPLPYWLSFPKGICVCRCRSGCHSRRESAFVFAFAVASLPPSPQKSCQAPKPRIPNKTKRKVGVLLVMANPLQLKPEERKQTGAQSAHGLSYPPEPLSPLSTNI